MSGTLVVQTLRGPASGANANKIIVPSGQTLDARAGDFLPAAGQIVQELHNKITVHSSFNSTSYTDAAGFNMNITPKYSDSLIVISVWAKTLMDNSTNQCGQDHRLLRDSAVVVHQSQWQNYFNRNVTGSDIYPPLDFTVIDQPNTTSQVNYKLQGRTYAGGPGAWATDSNGGTVAFVMSVKEIAQ